MRSQRQVWGETLVDLSREDEFVVVIDGDLATSTMASMVAEHNPEAFIQAGIAEQSMVGIAFGMSTLGYRPWLSSFGVFLTHRALDQIRMLVAQTGAQVRIAAAYAGLLNGSPATRSPRPSMQAASSRSARCTPCARAPMSR